jgi:hypothetical protein
MCAIVRWRVRLSNAMVARLVSRARGPPHSSAPCCRANTLVTRSCNFIRERAPRWFPFASASTARPRSIVSVRGQTLRDLALDGYCCAAEPAQSLQRRLGRSISPLRSSRGPSTPAPSSARRSRHREPRLKPASRSTATSLRSAHRPRGGGSSDISPLIASRRGRAARTSEMARQGERSVKVSDY